MRRTYGNNEKTKNWIFGMIFTGLVVLSISLKLDNRVDVEWLWVLSPLWVPGIATVIAVFWFTVFIVAIRGIEALYRWVRS